MNYYHWLFVGYASQLSIILSSIKLFIAYCYCFSVWWMQILNTRIINVEFKHEMRKYAKIAQFTYQPPEFILHQVQLELVSCCRWQTFSTIQIWSASSCSLHVFSYLSPAFFPYRAIPGSGKKNNPKSKHLIAAIVDLKVSVTHLRFFRFQIIFLFDALDPATGCISTILERTSSLFHANDFIARQSTKF